MKLDVEVRVEAACKELLAKNADLSALVGGRILTARDATQTADYPSCYVEAYNVAESFLHTGVYQGGLRLGAVSYADDDKDRSVCKAILGHLREFFQDKDLVARLNNTTAAKTTATACWFHAVQIDMSEAYMNETQLFVRQNEGIIEAMIIVMPARPTDPQ